MTTVKQILGIASQCLIRAGCDTPQLDAEVLLAHALDKNRAWLYTHPEKIPTPGQLNKFYNLLSRRECREPVAYLTGHKEFFGLDFCVNQHVLIPRPETELLIETAIQIVSQQANPVARQPNITIADVGTGSGCIAIALVKTMANVRVFTVDISSQALAVAQQNATHHQVADKIVFLQGDLLQPLAHSFDLVVSNPPYVSRAELRTAPPEVHQYEPGLALDGGQDGLNLVRQLLAQAREKLKPGGSLLVEIGATQGLAVTNLAKKHFRQADVEIKRDLAGLDRLLVIKG